MNNWQQKKLIDVADIKLSNVDKKTKENERIIRLCNYTDVYKNSFINKDKSTDFMVASCSENAYKKFILREGQVAITKDSEKPDDIGIPTYISEDFNDVVLGYHLSLITPFKDKLSGRFLNYWLQTKFSKRYFECNAGGSGQRCTLVLDVIKSIPLYLPSLANQNQIAKVLSDLDAKIEVNNKINQELEAMAKTLYDYWFVQFDFPDANGKPYKSSGGNMVYNEALKREFPDGWEDGTLLDIANFQNGLACQKFRPIDQNSLPVIKIKEMRDGFTDKTEKVRGDVPDRIKIYDGDVLFSWSASLEVMIWSGGNGALNQHIFKVTSDEYPKSYYYFELLNYLQHFKMIADLRKTTMGHITQDHLKQSRIAIPPIAVCEGLEQKIDPILKSIVSNHQQNQKLSELRDWLLPMLMNGQVTVGEAEKELGMVAEVGAVYENDKTAIDSLFASINYDYEVAVIVLLTRQILDRTYGKKFIHKMFSNIQFLEDLPIFEDLEFKENGWGMYCPIIEKTIKNQKYIYFDELSNERSVLNFNFKHLKEVSNWMKQDDNADFVLKVENMLSIYQKPLISKDMDRIELLNTVLESMHILETDNFDGIWYKMKNWKMYEDGYATKADKFKPEETRMMIDLIKELQ